MANPSLFNRLTSWAASASGTPAASIGAAALVAVWAACGPVFHYSETWQLVINTGTTIVTFLMVFLIQSSWSGPSRQLWHKVDVPVEGQADDRSPLLLRGGSWPNYAFSAWPSYALTHNLRWTTYEITSYWKVNRSLLKEA